MQKTCVYKIIVLSLHRKNKTIILITMKKQVANNSFRSRVFKEAHRLYNELRPVYRTFASALKAAWQSYRLRHPKRGKKVTATPERIEQIARNINAFNTCYDYIDGGNTAGYTWGFWNDLDNKLHTILSSLHKRSLNKVIALCTPAQAQYFNLV